MIATSPSPAAITGALPRYPHLARAPIVEAVIDWRATLREGFDIALFGAAQEQIQSEYQLVDEQREFQQRIEQRPGAEPKQSFRYIGVRGYRFRSRDGLHIATFSRDGFSFSRLKPYTNWASVFNEAYRLWQIYASLAEPDEISRIAIRYINRMHLPVPLTDFARYLTAPPAVAAGLPLVRSLLQRVVFYDPESDIATNVNQVMEAPEPSGLPLILDIDSFRAENMGPTGLDFAAEFGALREMKNRIFFATLTPTTIDMFK